MQNSTRIIYHRVQVNKKLLQFDYQNGMPKNLLNRFLSDQVTDTLPKGKCKGIYFISYIEKNKQPLRRRGNTPPSNANMAMPNLQLFLAHHTDIRIEDSRGHLITVPSDIRDYDRKSWDDTGYKKVDFNFQQNEQVTITFKTEGDTFPICGEFIFVIEEEKVC